MSSYYYSLNDFYYYSSVLSYSLCIYFVCVMIFNLLFIFVCVIMFNLFTSSSLIIHLMQTIPAVISPPTHMHSCLLIVIHFHISADIHPYPLILYVSISFMSLILISVHLLLLSFTSCRPFQPLSAFLLGSAPACRSSSTTSTSPPRAARYSGEACVCVCV